MILASCLAVAFVLIAAAGWVAYRLSSRLGPALAPRVDLDAPPANCPGCLMCEPPPWLNA